jgi:hypothetical protein
MWAGLYRNGLACDDGRRFFQGKSPYAIIEADDGMLYIALNGDGIWKLDPSPAPNGAYPPRIYGS